jgi:hypothetical protein
MAFMRWIIACGVPVPSDCWTNSRTETDFNELRRFSGYKRLKLSEGL